MSFKDYASLQEEIKSFLWDRADVVARIPSFIQLAEGEARRLLRTREVNGTRPFALSGNLSTIPCGAGTIKALRLGNTELDYLTPEQFAGLKPQQAGVPRFYTVQDDRIEIHPASSAQASGVIVFNEPFEPLSNVCRTNWLLKRHPDVYLCGALKWAKAWLIDADWDWATPFYSAIDAANMDDPRIPSRTTLRADEVTLMAQNGGFDMVTGGMSGPDPIIQQQFIPVSVPAAAVAFDFSSFYEGLD